jgi:hypothetical protein
MSAKLVVEAGGAGLQYQWYQGDAKVDGATNSTLALASVPTSQSGSYQAVVSNANGSATSQAAVLTVLPLAPLGTISGRLSLRLAFEQDYQDASGNGADGTAVGSPLFVPGSQSHPRSPRDQAGQTSSPDAKLPTSANVTMPGLTHVSVGNRGRNPPG